MTNPGSNSDRFELTDELLGAYADGELDRELLNQVETALMDDEPMRKRLADIRYVSSLARAVARAPLDGDSDELADKSDVFEFREHAAPVGSAPHSSPRAGMSHYAIAASLAAIAAAGFVWLGSAIGRPDPNWVDNALIYHEQLLDTARATHRVPLDFRNANPLLISNKIEPTLTFEPVIPDLSAHGFALVGARLIATPQGWMLYVSYKSEKGYLGLTAVQDDQETAEETAEIDGVNLVTWQEGDIAYSVTGGFDAERLAEIALDAQAAIEM